jgi:transposase-like protein
MKKKRKYLSQEEKEEILRLHYLEGVNQSELARRFDSSKMAINRLIHNFAASNDKSVLLMKNKPTDNQAEEIKALREEVLDLKKKLHAERMRADFYDTMIDVAEEMFNIEIRKKAGTG